VNLMVGCRMQQACRRRGGGSRQGGENPRWRNMSDVWQRQTEAHRSRCVGVDTTANVDGEAIFEQPWRRSLAVTRPDDARCVSEDDAQQLLSGRGGFGRSDTGTATRWHAAKTLGRATSARSGKARRPGHDV
jgi:hypothetical protein